MFRKMVGIITLFVIMVLDSQAMTPEEILEKIDRNEIYESIRYQGEMNIYLSGKVYEKTFSAYAKGEKNNFMVFTNPDDAGTKYLKKEGNLFVYSPDAEEIMPITGHMLKESIMGSDMSYEDTINNDGLAVRYTPEFLEDAVYNGIETWVLELKAKKRTESYPKQVIWVAKDTYSILKSEMYALSGAKLKEMRNIRIEKIGSRHFPVEVEMVDLLRKNSKTVLKMDKIELDVSIPDSMFSFKNLER